MRATFPLVVLRANILTSEGKVIVFVRRWGFFTLPNTGADSREPVVANCLRHSFPPLDLRGVRLARPIVIEGICGSVDGASSVGIIDHTVCVNYLLQPVGTNVSVKLVGINDVDQMFVCFTRGRGQLFTVKTILPLVIYWHYRSCLHQALCRVGVALSEVHESRVLDGVFE